VKIAAMVPLALPKLETYAIRARRVRMTEKVIGA
jgi:hypothetical protein